MKHLLLIGPFVGELYWEAGRFLPYVLYKKRELRKQYKDLELVVYTRSDRFDIYGKNASSFLPLDLYEDKYVQDCFKLTGLKCAEYNNLASKFYIFCSKLGRVVDHIYPDISKKHFCDKNQFKVDSSYYHNLFDPRDDNKFLVDNFLDSQKKTVVLAPRYRKKIQRNWPYWQDLYDIISNSSLVKSCDFVICGKKPDYIPDKNNVFKDINSIGLTKNSSVFGLTIEVIKRAVLTVGSQSALPNISLLFRVPVLEWGNQKALHIITYNPLRTPVKFIEDLKFNIKPDVVFKELERSVY